MPTRSLSPDVTHLCANGQQELLQQSEERFLNLVDNVPGAVYRCVNDAQRTMAFLSEAIETIAGYPASEFIDDRIRSFASIIHPQDRGRVQEAIGQSTATGSPYVLEYRIVRADGEIRWLCDRGRGVPCHSGASEGGCTYWLDGVLFDITERKQIETELRQTKAFLDSVIENLPIGVFIKDAQHLRFLYWNKTSEDLFGHPKDSIVGKTDYDISPNEQARQVRAHDRQVLTGEKLVEIPEASLITPHRGERILHKREVPLLDEAGTPQYLLAICEDITERQRAEIALRESECHYRRIVETASEGVWVFDADNRTTFVNNRMAQMLGYTVEDMQGRSLFEFVEEAHQTLAHTYAERRRQGLPERYDFKFRRQDGSDLWTMVSATPIVDAAGCFVGILRMITDISDRKRAEEALRESHQQIIRILERLTDAFFGLDHQWRFTYLNGEAERAFGQSQDALVGANFWEIFPDAVGSIVEQEYQRAIAKQVPVTFETFIARWESWLEVRAYPDTEGLSVFWRDITERKRAEEQLQEREQFLSSIYDGVENSIFVVDVREEETPNVSDAASPTPVREFRYRGVNSTHERWTGICSEDVRDKVPEAVWSPDIAAAITERYRQCVRAQQPISYEECLPFHGEETWWLSTLTPLRDSQGRVYRLVGTSTNISDRKQAEAALQRSEAREREKAQQLELTLRELKRTQAQLVQNEKMVSLGQMVAGVAHEINNPTGFIYGNVTHARQYACDLLHLIALYRQHYPNPVPEIDAEIETIDLDFVATDFPKLLQSIRDGANRIREIVLSLRNFSRLDQATLKPVNLHEGIDSTLLILQHRLKESPSRPEIQIIKQYGQLPLVECHAGKLNQVFMNLLSNAIDALEVENDVAPPENREATATASSAPTRASWTISSQTPTPTIWISTEQIDKQRVAIRIRDNGTGIPRDLQQRIFDPFFTTKPVGVGTGLGLSISHSIVVEQHGGQLTCTSAPGRGTEFVIELPIQMVD